MIIINDAHLGAQRTGGTTPQSAQALRDGVRDNLSRFLYQHKGEHVLCNGDLLDRFEIDSGELIEAYEVFSNWLCSGLLNKLTLVMGNHDASAKGNKVSSFHLLSHFLSAQHPHQFRMIDHTDGFCQVSGNVFAISHQMNQDLFALEVEKACATKHEGEYLLLHANIKNTFAEHSDHSLNLTDDLLAKLMIAGWTLIVGHEHQSYTLRGGRVIVVGNQWPTSVSDCIGEKSKNALVVTETSCFTVPTWQAEGNYAEIDWRDIAEHAGEEKFIRVVGEATSAESADVIAIISRFRQKSDAYVISNAVKIEGAEAFSDMASTSLEDVRGFDVLAAIYSELTPAECDTVKELLS